MFDQFKKASIFLVIFSSITAIQAGCYTRKLTLDDTLGVMQVAKATAVCDKEVYSHLGVYTEYSVADKEFKTIYRDVYRPMNAQEIEQEIDRAKVCILKNMRNGLDIFVCSDESGDIFYGCIFAEDCGSNGLVEYTKIYISPAGKVNYYDVMWSMKNTTEAFYKSLSIYKGIVLKYKQPCSDFFKNHGYVELSEQEALSQGFTQQNSFKNHGLFSAALAILSGVGAYSVHNEYFKTKVVLGGMSLASSVYALCSMISYHRNTVYYKAL